MAVVIGLFDPLRDFWLKLGQPKLLLDFFCCSVFPKTIFAVCFEDGREE